MGVKLVMDSLLQGYNFAREMQLKKITTFEDVFNIAEYVFYREKEIDKKLKQKWDILYSMIVYAKYFHNKDFLKYNLGELFLRNTKFIHKLDDNLYNHNKHFQRIKIISVDPLYFYSMIVLISGTNFECLKKSYEVSENISKCYLYPQPASSFLISLRN